MKKAVDVFLQICGLVLLVALTVFLLGRAGVITPIEIGSRDKWQPSKTIEPEGFHLGTRNDNSCVSACKGQPSKSKQSVQCPSDPGGTQNCICVCY